MELRVAQSLSRLLMQTSKASSNQLRIVPIVAALTDGLKLIKLNADFDVSLSDDKTARLSGFHEWTEDKVVVGLFQVTRCDDGTVLFVLLLEWRPEKAPGN